MDPVVLSMLTKERVKVDKETKGIIDEEDEEESD
jgi:hypothetical protein